MREEERQRDINYKSQIENKINTIDKLTELNNSHRFFKRGTVAFENLGMHNHSSAKKKM